jgi:hypothetical protein
MKTELSHESLSELIPWYANSTLSPEEHALVEEHLKSCDACQGELEWLRTVGAAMTEVAAEVPVQAPSFAKTMAAIDEWERSKEPARVSRLVSWFQAFWNPSAPMARFAFVAQFALILGLGIFILSHRQGTVDYTTLSGSEQAGGGAKLTVSFAPNTTVERMASILGGVGGRIVSGPSASGIFVVELPIRPEKDADVQAAIDKLRMDQVIRFVERQP